MVKTIQVLFDLSGKVAIVTGAAMGIGKGIALRLAEAGASVMIADINLGAAEQTANEMQAAGFWVKEVQADTSKVANGEKTVREAIAAFSRLDILVNNAGIFLMTAAL